MSLIESLLMESDNQAMGIPLVNGNVMSLT